MRAAQRFPADENQAVGDRARLHRATGDEGTRREARQITKVADEVGLVVIPGIARDHAPVLRSRGLVDRPLQPHAARELLRGNANALDEHAA